MYGALMMAIGMISGIFVSLIIGSLIIHVINIAFGAKTISVNLFGILFHRTGRNNEKWVVKRTGFKPYIKFQDDNTGLTRGREKCMSVIAAVIFGTIIANIVFVIWKCPGFFISDLGYFMKYVLVFGGFMFLGMLFTTFSVFSKATELHYITNDIFAEVKRKGSISGVNCNVDPKIFNAAPLAAKEVYQNFRLLRAEYMGDMATMAEVVKWYEWCEREQNINRSTNRRSTTTLTNDSLKLQMLFYYSYFYNAPDKIGKARRMYTNVEKLLKAGVDSDDKRIYAYYLYYVENNAGEAERIANEGLEMMKDFSDEIPEFKAAEEKWLEYLKGQIFNRKYCVYDR